MSDHTHSKKHKKQLQVAKNRHLQQIQQMDADLGRSRDLDREREEELRDAAQASSRAASKAGKESPTFRKLDEIRNKNTHRARVAQDRWNRFAGTESGGGRGL